VKPAGPFTSASKSSKRKLPVLGLALLAVAYCATAFLTSALTTRGPHSAGAASVPGEWLVDRDGAVLSVGGAPNYGSASNQWASPIVGMASAPGGGGYWETAANGAIYSYGDAPFYGSMGSQPLNAPIVGMATTPDGKGYWEVASDGGIFSYGDAAFYGSTGSLHLNAPIVGMESTSDGKGYWLVAGDGGIFNYGDAGFFGSTGSIRLNQPIVGMATTPNGSGYWMAARDGGIFSFGDAGFFGSTPALDLAPVSAITATPDGEGYWEAATDGAVYPHGDAASFGADGMALPQPVVGAALSVLSTGSASAAPSPQGQMAPPTGYTATQMTFDDTFSGSSLNTSNWTPELAPGSVWNDESLPSGDSSAGSNQAAYWAPSQATVDNGLTLSARQTTSSDAGYSKGFNWVSGVVSSKFTLPSTGWYVQIDAKMPDTSDGMWPALWFLPSNSAQEFDGLEGGWNGSNANEQGHSDLFLGSGQQQDVWSTPGGTNITAGYNTYGFQYIPGVSVTTYFNGQKVYSVNSSSVSSEAYYLLIELQVASSATSGWHTALSSSTPSPSNMDIAEVQVYS
jgi:hypothetical protein